MSSAKIGGRSRVHTRRACACACALTVLAFVPRSACAQVDPGPEITEKPCVLPHFAGKVVSAVGPEQCGVAQCSVEHALTLEDPDDNTVFGVEDTTVDGDPEPPALACEDASVVLRWVGQELHFELHGGGLSLATADRRRVAGLWQAPPARSPSGIEAHASLARLVDVAFTGTRDSDVPPPAGLDQELVRLAELVTLRDHLRAGEFQIADERITGLERDQVNAPKPYPPRGKSRTGEYIGPPPLPPVLWAHVLELRHELDAARRRSTPFSLGPRRFVGGAQRLLGTPLDVAEAPQLFFRGAELCVVEVAPLRSPKPNALAWPEDRMRCFAPNATSPRETEPLALPASSAANLGYRAIASMWNHCPSSLLVMQKPVPQGDVPCEGGPAVGIENLLAVVNGDAMLAVSNGGLELVRSATARNKVSPAEAGALVAGSAGSRLFARTASYFLDTRRVAQIAGGEDRTWDVLGKPPDGAYWVGTPLVSPDQRWVVAQSGNGNEPVSLWVFRIVR